MDRTNSRGLWRYANEFYEAGVTVASGKTSAPMPAYYLMCHSLELALKAFLRGKGLSVKDLADRKTLGHNLESLLKKAEAEGISHYLNRSDGLRESVDLINQYYSKKELEYIRTGFKQLPEFSQISAAVESVILGIEEFCLVSMNYHEGKPTAVA